MIQSGLGEPPQDVLQDSAVLEVLDLNVGVEAHFHVERLAGVGGHLQGLVDLQVAFLDAFDARRIDNVNASG